MTSFVLVPIIHIMKNTKIKETIEKLHKQVNEFVDEGKYQDYLKFINKFWNRSAFNQLLIYMFKDKATYVMGYKQWIDKFNRIPVACIECRAIAVKDCDCEERRAPIRIPQLAPMTYTKVDEETQEEEQKMFFKEVYVFDISDTEPLPDLPIKEIVSLVEWVDVEIEDENLGKTLIQLINEHGFKFRYDDTGSDTLNGWTDYTKREIVVSNDRPKAQQIKTLVHEIGHMLAHDIKTIGDIFDPRELKECEAESIAFVVLDTLGIDTSSYSVGYVAGWTDNEEDLLVDSIQTVSKNAKFILEYLRDNKPE